MTSLTYLPSKYLMADLSLSQPLSWPARSHDQTGQSNHFSSGHRRRILLPLHSLLRHHLSKSPKGEKPLGYRLRNPTAPSVLHRRPAPRDQHVLAGLVR